LGTGNFRATGIAKLRYYGIDAFFPNFVGGFGDDHELREELIRVGIARLQDGELAERIVIVGDTTHDIAAARANGAFALAVATGRDSIETLRAAGADAVLEDLSRTDEVVEIIAGIA
jgi:phosphoglycolate phosphatase-like HAD superfamily hydrolase